MEFYFFEISRINAMKSVLLAVNGTLMRGLPLNQNLLEVNAVFCCESKTCGKYRLWSIGDQYPGMLRDEELGHRIELEIWEVSPEALVTILQKEPPGLCIGKIELANGEMVLGVLAEPGIIQNQIEITQYGGWRNYLNN
jgi:gamma-glutamylcyclotransferase (GGCT)/AIG2-like uncharacterized protein YtfP